MLRIASAHAYDAGVDSLQSRQRELSEAQQRLTSGKRVARASDDPAAAARAERAMAATARADANQRALEASRSAMSQSESALGDAGDLLQQAREQLVAAGNPTWGAAERGYAADRLRGLREQLLSVANRGDGAGGYLFGGQGIDQAPFIDAPGAVAWRATAGTQQSASDESLPLTLDGRSTWLGARSGNGVFETSAVTSTGTAWIDAGRVTDPAALTGADYALSFSFGSGGTTYSVTRNGAATALTNVTYQSGSAIEIDGLSFTISGQPANGDTFRAAPSQADLSVFDALDRAITALNDPLANAGQVTQAVQTGLRDMDAVMSNMNSLRADAGAWLNRIDNVESRIAGAKLQSQTERSNAEDLDMVQAVSEFQNKQSSYQAALQTYSMVQRLSLFQYLNN